MGPQALRMNLNTLLRHEVLGNGKADREMVDYVAAASRTPRRSAARVSSRTSSWRRT
jgi:hypothetical protein